MYSEEQIKEILRLTKKGNTELRAWLEATKGEIAELSSMLDRVEKKIDTIREELEII